jgi:uncharacterized lipoprotein YmbA
MMLRRFRPQPRHLALGLIAVTVAALAGCATSPKEHFYTLNGATGTAAAAAVPAPGTGVSYYVEVAAVSVPAQVSRNQLVVMPAGGGVDILEQERWAGPLTGEITQALSLGITGTLGAIDVYRTPYPDKAAVYRISTNVQRFESVPDSYALIDAVWSVRQLSSGKVVTCRTVAREGVGSGYESLVDGHRKAVAQMAGAVSAAIRGLAGDGQSGCPPIEKAPA